MVANSERAPRRFALYFTGALLFLFVFLGVESGSGRITSFFEPLIAFPALLFLFRKSRVLPRFDSALIVFLCLYAGYYTVSWAWGIQPEGRLEDMLRGVAQSLVAVAAIALACTAVPVDRFPRVLMVILAVAGAVLGLASIVHFYVQLGHPLKGRLEPLGSASNSITGLYYYALPLLCAGLGAWYERGWVRGLYAGCALVLLVTFYLTYSRGPALGLVAVLAGFLLWKSPRLALFSIPVGVAGIAGLWTLFGSREWLARLDTGRFDIWQSALSKIPDAWLWGHGNSLFNHVYLSPIYGYQHGHNIWISHAFWGGLVAVVLLALVYGRSFLLMWQRRHSNYLAELGLLLWGYALVVLMVGGNVLLTYPGVYWFVFVVPVGLALGVSASDGQRREAAQ